MQPENKRALQGIEGYARRLDPLETVTDGYDDHDLVEGSLDDIDRLDEILATDHTLTPLERHQTYEAAVDARLDYMYAKSGGMSLPMPEFAQKAKVFEEFMNSAAAQARKHYDRHPQDYWALQAKVLDLRTLAAHRFAADAKTTLEGTTAGAQLMGHARDVMRSVLHDSLELVVQMEKKSHGHDITAQDARGSLYEMLLLTYSRAKVFKDKDQLGSVLVRSALEREDQPWNDHVYPKRAFDIVIKSPDGVRLLQAKNHYNRDEYEWPIQKIEDGHFGSTLENIPRHILDLNLMVDDRLEKKDPLTKIPVLKAEQRLDSVFGAQLQAPEPAYAS
jgi:hypothetical protein